MLKQLLICAFLMVVAITAKAADFPRPSSLEPAVRFWTSVYTDITTHQGYLHDDTVLSVVYETLDFPTYMNHAVRQREIDAAKARVSKALASLAAGKRSGLSDIEARVLKAWPQGTSSETFRQARQRLRFQLGQADRFKAGLVRSGRWKPHIRRVLATHRLPQELEVLPHVESSFNPNAYSKVAAAGMWQFMPATARQYMRVDHIIDERMDPYVATEGAAKLLKRNFQVLGNWPLALTAYNFGAGGLLRATRAMGTSDIGPIVAKYRGPAFGFASRNFYASFLAALDVDRNAERYFGPVTLEPPLDYDIVELEHYVPAHTLAERVQVSLDELKVYNPSLRDTIWSGEKYIPRGFVMRLPKGQGRQTLSAAVASLAGHEYFNFQKPDVLHKVRPGESLSVIARRYDTSVARLMALNGLRNHNIRAGANLRLPGAVQVAEAPAPRESSGSESVASAGTGKYVIESGDSLWSIARKFNISQRELVAWNKISNQNHIRPGQTLNVSGAGKAAEYTIQPGDSLWAIARRFNVAQANLMKWNNLQKGHVIKPGQVLRLASN